LICAVVAILAPLSFWLNPGKVEERADQTIDLMARATGWLTDGWLPARR